MPFGGVVVNKVNPGSGADGEGVEPELAELLGDEELAARVAANFDDFQALAARDRANIDRLTSSLGGSAVIEVPYLDHDVHDLTGLLELDRWLFAESAKARATGRLAR